MLRDVFYLQVVFVFCLSVQSNVFLEGNNSLFVYFKGVTGRDEEVTIGETALKMKDNVS